MERIIISRRAQIKIIKILWTKVHLLGSIILTPTPRLGLKKNRKISGLSHGFSSITRISVLLFLTLFFYSCTKSPEPINYGRDECEHCRMMITNDKYGAEIITDKGKIFKFDSIECLVEFALEKKSVGDNNQAFLVTDFSAPQNLIDARTAYYVQNDSFRSPMGLNVSAFINDSELQKFLTVNSGRKLTWLEVIELVKQNIM